MKNLLPVPILEDLSYGSVRENGDFVAGLPAQPSPSTSIAVHGIPTLVPTFVLRWCSLHSSLLKYSPPCPREIVFLQKRKLWWPVGLVDERGEAEIL